MTEALWGTQVETRWVPERRLAVFSREIAQHEVSEFLAHAYVLLFDFTNAHPGLRATTTTETSPTYAIYHGNFGGNSSAVVEACAVLDGDVAPSGDIGVRIERAHTEAYLTMTRRRLALPALSAAYETLGSWVVHHGRFLSQLPPREVYLADVMTAHDDQHVCDVAIPFEPRVT